MKKAIIYARQSSGSDDFSASVENQIENCKALAEREQIEVIGIFSDLNTSGKTYPAGAESIAATDGAFQAWFNQQTGSKMFRQGLGDALRMLDGVEFIIVDDITRLYRPVTRSFLENYINNILAEKQVEVRQVKGGAIDLNKFDSALITMLRNAINDEQIRNCKAKSMQALRKRREAGLYANGGGKAFGTSYSRETGKIHITSKGEAVARLVFAEYLKGTALLQIVNALNAGYTDAETRAYYYSNVYHVLANPVYAGYMLDNEGLLVKNQQIENPVITLTQYLEAKDIMAKRSKQQVKARKNPLPFSGLLFCGECGAKLTSNTDKGNVYYNCRNAAFRQGKHAAGHSVYIASHGSYRGLQDAIAPIIARAYLRKLEEAEKDAANVEAVKAELANLESKKGGLIEMFKKGLLTCAELESALQDVKTAINAARAKIMTAGDSVKAHFSAWMNKSKALAFADGEYTQEEYAEALRKTIDSITVFPSRVEVKTQNGDTYSLAKDKRRGITSFVSMELDGACKVIDGVDVRNVEKIA